jgi:hypothetical protein
MKLYGSLNNRMMEGSKQEEPKVGMGATITMYTDRKAGTIVKVTRTQVHVQLDTAIRTDNNGMDESQAYRYERNPEAKVAIFRKTKRGYRNSERSGLLIGHRDAYHDYSF